VVSVTVTPVRKCVGISQTRHV